MLQKIPTDKNGKSQKKEVNLELLGSTFLVWVENGTGPPVQATIEVLGPEKSTIKLMKGGYRVVETSKIKISCPR